MRCRTRVSVTAGDDAHTWAAVGWMLSRAAASACEGELGRGHEGAPADLRSGLHMRSWARPSGGERPRKRNKRGGCELRQFWAQNKNWPE
jgi:hypothetical protein